MYVCPSETDNTTFMWFLSVLNFVLPVNPTKVKLSPLSPEVLSLHPISSLYPSSRCKHPRSLLSFYYILGNKFKVMFKSLKSSHYHLVIWFVSWKDSHFGIFLKLFLKFKKWTYLTTSTGIEYVLFHILTFQTPSPFPVLNIYSCKSSTEHLKYIEMEIVVCSVVTGVVFSKPPVSLPFVPSPLWDH